MPLTKRYARNHAIGYMALPGLKGKFVFPKLQKGSPIYIERAVCDALGEDFYSIRTGGRTEKLATCRGIIMFLQRKYTDLTLVEIAAKFSMHHTSIMSAIKKIDNLMKTDPAVRDQVQKIEMQIQ